MGVTATFGSRVGEIEGIGKAMLAAVEGLLEAEIEHTVRPLRDKPSINDFLLHNHNIL